MVNFHKFKIGTLDCFALEDNRQDIDIRQEFKQVPEDALLSAMKTCGYADFNVTIGFNNLLVQTKEGNVLIDCGTGMNNLAESLSAAGFSPEDINFVIITHSDFDHIGGIDLFTNAKIIFPKMAFDLWTNAQIRKDMIGNFKEIFLKFLSPEFVEKGAAYREHYGAEKLPALAPRMMLVAPDQHFLPNFKLHFTPGHRPDHFAVEITSGTETLIHIADGFRHELQANHPEWYSRFDSYPEQMTDSLNQILKYAKEQNAQLFGAHFLFPGLAKFEGDQVRFIGRD